jgi:predicted metal-dependent enzyme (double-stranded beta helix superfamily)
MEALARPFSPLSCQRKKSAYTVADLIDQVKRCALSDDVQGVRQALEGAINDHPGFLPAHLLATKGGSYARRELHTDRDGKFSILAMVWAPGQGTPLHDHGGLWVVEAVYEGRMNVANYEYLGLDCGLHQFAIVDAREDNAGDSDYRLPPSEHHILMNKSQQPSVTIHVFGGILRGCNQFEPTVGGYRKLPKAMSLD